MNYENLKNMQKIQEYVTNMRPAFNKRAVFSDETESYRMPFEPKTGDTVKIRIRTKRGNVDMVCLVSGQEKKKMNLVETRDGFDYYETKLLVGTETIHYHFELFSGKVHCYYNRFGIVKDLDEHYAFGIVPGFETPDWAKGAVMYQIFVDRFCNGDKSNDVVTNEYSYISAPVQKVEDWNRPPQAMDVRDFYGGDLQGVWDKLDYLQDLGVDVIYFNPIFVSPSNHKYDIQDYDHIDPHFGRIVDDGGEALPEGVYDNVQASRYIKRVTSLANLEASNRLFAQLVDEAHKRGIRVIIDGVFNHCGSFNKWLDKERIYEGSSDFEKGAYVSADSPYRDFFQFNDPNRWPYNNTYNGWWGHDTLPKLNYEGSEKLEQYILDIGRKWVSPPYNVDGWRLDVAADLGFSEEYNHRFWKKFRNAVKEANPDAVILAEHYGDCNSWLHGDEWDTIMNYDAFMEPITWFLTGMEKHSDSYDGNKVGNPSYFFDAARHNMSRMGGSPVRISMNELSNHDHSRFLTRTNRTVGRTESRGPKAAEENVNKAVFMEAVIVQMSWPGAPTVYYGDEAGVCGWTDPDNRRTYPWGNEDMQLVDFHRDVIRIHRNSKALMTGSYKKLYGDYNIISYGRFTADSKAVTIINNNDSERTVVIDVWECGLNDGDIMKAAIVSDNSGYRTDGGEYEVVSGKIKVTLNALSGMILIK